MGSGTRWYDMTLSSIHYCCKLQKLNNQSFIKGKRKKIITLRPTTILPIRCMNKRASISKCIWVDPQCKCEWWIGTLQTWETCCLKITRTWWKVYGLPIMYLRYDGDTWCNSIKIVNIIIIKCRSCIKWIISC